MAKYKIQGNVVTSAEQYNHFTTVGHHMTIFANPSTLYCNVDSSSLNNCIDIISYKDYIAYDEDDFGKIIRKVSKNDTSTTITTYKYDEYGLLVKETLVINYTEAEKEFTTITEYSYDVYKNLIKTVSYVVGEELKNGKAIEEWVYDDKGNLLKSFMYKLHKILRLINLYA